MIVAACFFLCVGRPHALLSIWKHSLEWKLCIHNYLEFSQVSKASQHPHAFTGSSHCIFDSLPYLQQQSRPRAKSPLCSLRTTHWCKSCLSIVLLFQLLIVFHSLQGLWYLSVALLLKIQSSPSCLLISMSFHTVWLPKNPFCPFHLGF